MTHTVIKYLVLLLLALPATLAAQKVIIPMDKSQTDHLKAYGIAYWCLERNMTVEWLLNYRGGAFLIDDVPLVRSELTVRGVSSEPISSGQAEQIKSQIAGDETNMDVMKLDKAPKIVVYVPSTNLPWDDAVTLVLTYAEIPYVKIWDEEVMRGDLKKYDWLHVHHEDFTGQYGKFWSIYRNAPWYMKQVRDQEQVARKLGFTKVSEEKKAVARTIAKFVGDGGFMFAMCAAPDSYDIALAAEQVDIVAEPFDGDGFDPNCNSKLDFSKTFAFENFSIDPNPYSPAKDNFAINPNASGGAGNEESEYFSLFEFSAKYDPVPTMLTQNHLPVVKGFTGLSTSFLKEFIKKPVVIMGEKKGSNEVKYLHGNYGKGQFCFYGGHDPEDYTHAVGDPPTDLALHKNSAGYRLILNNVLFPAAQKKKQKT
jgi:hypothetical protein